MGEKLVKSLLNAYRNQWVEVQVCGKKKSGYLVKAGRKWEVAKTEFSQKEVAQFHVYQFAEPTIVVSLEI